MNLLLGAFAELRKAAISFLRPSARIEQLGSHWTDLHEVCCLKMFLTSVERGEVTLKSDKDNGYFTRRPVFIYDDTSLNSS
jgi:hypothetical protein